MTKGFLILIFQVNPFARNCHEPFSKCLNKFLLGTGFPGVGVLGPEITACEETRV